MHQNEIPPGTLYLLILKALARGRELHGFEIARWIEQVSDEVLQVEEGSLYPALQRMLIKGWVKAKWGVTAGNRRARYYRLTPLGRKQLEVEVSQFERVVAAITRAIQTALRSDRHGLVSRTRQTTLDARSSRQFDTDLDEEMRLDRELREEEQIAGGLSA